MLKSITYLFEGPWISISPVISYAHQLSVTTLGHEFDHVKHQLGC